MCCRVSSTISKIPPNTAAPTYIPSPTTKRHQKEHPLLKTQHPQQRNRILQFIHRRLKRRYARRKIPPDAQFHIGVIISAPNLFLVHRRIAVLVVRHPICVPDVSLVSFSLTQLARIGIVSLVFSSAHWHQEHSSLAKQTPCAPVASWPTYLARDHDGRSLCLARRLRLSAACYLPKSGRRSLIPR